MSRSELLMRAGAGVVAATIAGGSAPYAFAGPLRYARRSLKGELSIVQWRHFETPYDDWLDGKWATAWGEQNDVEVSIDHVDLTRLPALAAAEAKARTGHDIFGFLSPPAAFEDHVIDHGGIVRQVESRVGPYGDLGLRSTFNPRTGKYFGISDCYVPAPVIWRHDLWNAVGASPATWDDVRDAAPTLKQLGHPIGIGQSLDSDSTTALVALLMCFGSYLQDESGDVAIDSENTVEAVQFMADLYRSGQEDRVFGWNLASNNQYLLSGRGSMIVNAISAVRTAEDLQPAFANDLWLWPIPTGPGGRLAPPQTTGVYSIWEFARNREAAEQFLVDLCAGYEAATLASSLFNYPSFPGAFPAKRLYRAAAADTHPPRGKYTILTTAASKHTRNLGYPGYANVAVQETLDTYLIPKMFAGVSQGRMTAADSVRSTARQMKRIWAKGRAAGKL